MPETPTDRKYLQTHEWHKPTGDGTVTLGITQFAADELTDVTYVALPKVGQSFKAGDRFGEVESVKATSDLYTGVAGTVAEVNEAVNADPGLVNRDPYEGGWLIKLTASNPADVDQLLAVGEYLKKIGQ
jgi:glycine cleavage system H protein